MRTLSRSLTAAAATLALPALAAAQTVNFGSYVSVGDSLASGFVSGALVQNHQATSVPALIARQAGVSDFQQPLVSAPGIPSELQLLGLAPTPTIVRAPGQGAPLNLGLARPYNNLAVPGATLIDAVTRISDGGGLHDLILRGRGTQIAQAAALRPTFVTLWIGNNDVLGAAVSGRAIDGVTLTPPAAFRTAFAGAVGALKATGATVIAANLPDVTTIAYVNTVRPIVVNPATQQPVVVNGQTVPLFGPGGPLPATSKVTLGASALLAQGIGIPAALGGRAAIVNGICQNCLPDEVVLDASEIAIISAHVDADNQAIREVCAAAGVPVVDINAFLRQTTTGVTVGGITLSTNFLTGGLVSYDGVHPTDLGYALVANEWIRVINQNGGNLQPVDLQPYLKVKSGSAAVAAESVRDPGAVFSLEAYESLREIFGPVNRK